MSLRELVYKERIFVLAYLGVANGNATEAARIAGLKCPSVTGCKLLKKANVRAAIDAKVSSVAISADEVLARLSDIASATICDVLDVNEDGTLLVNIRTARRRGKDHLIKKVVPTKYGLSIELHDAQSALEKLGRYYGLFGRDANQGTSLDARSAESLLAQSESDAGIGDDGDSDDGGDGESGQDCEGAEEVPG